MLYQYFKNNANVMLLGNNSSPFKIKSLNRTFSAVLFNVIRIGSREWVAYKIPVTYLFCCTTRNQVLLNFDGIQ